MAQSDIILPIPPLRTKAEDSYKQCVAIATSQLLTTNRSIGAVVRDSVQHCSGLRYAMLNAYPKKWRASYGRQLDAEVYQYQLSLIRQQRQPPPAN